MKNAILFFSTLYILVSCSTYYIKQRLPASAENKDAEGDAILKKVRDLSQGGPAHLIAMTEWGKRSTSVAFAEWTKALIERPAKVFFLIAGAEGFSDEVLKACQERISLSELT
ncbi:MAG: hypothetical protein EBS07_09010, partial [Sphingobacteriia bacterium]|nr:hypothetical protein [Sphingobacteriia bacterium]